MEQKTAHKRTFTGTVVSAGMHKTLVVSIDSVKTHPKYGKQFVRSKKYHVHDEANAHKVGDVVTFIECRRFRKQSAGG